MQSKAGGSNVAADV
jgi:cell division cycle protein 20 (cofactor of APC complex)